MLLPHVFNNVFVSVFQHGLGPIKMTNPLLIVQAIILLAVLMYDPNGIPVCVRTGRHESFVVMSLNAMSLYQCVEGSPKHHLRIKVLGLHVTTCDGHHTAIGQVVDMTNHGGLVPHLFDVVKQYPNILKVPLGLLHFTKSTPLPGATSDILNTKTLSALHLDHETCFLAQKPNC